MLGVWFGSGVCGKILLMGTLRFLCFVSLLALIVFAGTADSGGPADPCEAEELAAAAARDRSSGDQGRQDSAGIAITMTGQEAADENRQGSAGIGISMTGEQEEEDGSRARVDLVARTGSPDGG